MRFLPVVERSCNQFFLTMWSVANTHHYITCVSLFSAVSAQPSDVPLDPKVDNMSSSSREAIMSLVSQVLHWEKFNADG